jgi:hypothetical protein
MKFDYDIYLSGPMTGYPEWNHPAFHAATDRLRSLGFTVFNPAEVFDGDCTRDRSEYMRADIEALLRSDMIVTLPAWECSQGAKLEVRVAEEIGIPHKMIYDFE